MDEQRFWLVGNRGRVSVVTDQAQAARLATGGAYRCDGPFVPESELTRAVTDRDALLVKLHLAAHGDVPRDVCASCEYVLKCLPSVAGGQSGALGQAWINAPRGRS